jgi:uncharacterized membrane protein YphA (DoxX/SURF4 family)
VSFHTVQANLVPGELCLLRRNTLQKLFSAFPGGWPGLGLLLLRIAVASHLIVDGLRSFDAPDLSGLPAWPLAMVAILLGTALLIGFLTPLAGTASTLGYLALGFSQLAATHIDKPNDISTFFCFAVISLALTLLGPGAASLDARLFGRREIVIP